MAKIDILKVYDYLHSIPELGFKEVKTAAFLAEQLQKLGYQVTTGVGGTGVIGTIKGQEPGPVLMLRADMDALPFTVDGKAEVRHACGHDSHCSMMLAAAAVLADKVKKGTLKILFQPAEEIGTGALAVIKDGALEGVDYILGLHNRPVQDIPDGTLTPAVNHSALAQVAIDIEGKSSHGARPHLGVNAAETAAVLTTAIMSIKLNPVKTWSCKVTAIQCGSVFNIIPEKAHMLVDCRAEDNETIDEMLTKLQQAVDGVALAMGAKITLTTPTGIIPAPQYAPEMVQLLADSIVAVAGKEHYREPITNPGGEDFHFFTRKYPKLKAGYLGVGAGATPGLHAVNMHLNKNSLQNGADVLVHAALKIIG